MNLVSPLPADGVKIPIYATFTGWKTLPWLALGTNGASPLLRVYEDRLVFKVLRPHSRNYDEIAEIGVLTWHLTRNIYFVWRDTQLTLSANVIRKDWLIEIVQFFHRKNLALTPAALELIEKSA